MEVIKINVAKTAARAKQIELVTTGMVGASVRFSFGSEWNGLTRTAVFRAGKVAKDVVLTSDTALIPPEVLAAPASLLIGVYGSNSDGTLVIPTVMVRACFVLPGADPSGDESTDPTLSVWQQILAQIGPMDELGTEAKDSLVAAINEVIKLAGGDIDPEVLAAAVKEYLAANPVPETDPTVPAWAKQPTKPEYTAEEVGAQIADCVVTFSKVNGEELTADKTFEEVKAAYNEGRTLVGMYRGQRYDFYSDGGGEGFGFVNRVVSTLDYEMIWLWEGDSVQFRNDVIQVGYPVTSVNGMTGAVVLDIPTDDHINQLINTALAAIPNAAEVAY